MILFDNIIFSLQSSGGVSVIWHEILKRIVTDHTYDCRFIEYDNAVSNIFRKSLYLPPERIAVSGFLPLFVARYLNSHYRYSVPFVCHSSYYRTCVNKQAINIITVYDFTYEYFFPRIKRIVHSSQKWRAIRNADYIICISESTKRDLLKFIPDAAGKDIRVVHCGIADDYYPMKPAALRELPFEFGAYVLFVGARAKYKNFAVAVNAVAASSLNLVIVGGNDLSREEQTFLNEKLGGARYRFLGRVSNERMNVLYNGAQCLLYPSSYEGFGIPVLEAQRAGCPVIACNSSSIPEIIGDTPLLLDKSCEKTINECFALLDNAPFRRKVIESGVVNAANFSWDTTYEKTKIIYDEAIAKAK